MEWVRMWATLNIKNTWEKGLDLALHVQRGVKHLSAIKVVDEEQYGVYSK